MNSLSEFATLVEKLALRGYPRIKLLSEIHDLILYEYKIKFPGKPRDVRVSISEETGAVKIIAGGENIVPEDFLKNCEKLAKDYTLDKLQSLTASKK